MHGKVEKSLALDVCIQAQSAVRSLFAVYFIPGHVYHFVFVVVFALLPYIAYLDHLVWCCCFYMPQALLPFVFNY